MKSRNPEHDIPQKVIGLWGVRVARVCLGVVVGIGVAELAWAYGDAGFTDVVRRTVREVAWWNPFWDTGDAPWNQFREMPGYRSVWEDRRALWILCLGFLHLMTLFAGCLLVLAVMRARRYWRDQILCAVAIGLSVFALWGYRGVANAGIIAQLRGEKQKWEELTEKISRDWPAPGKMLKTNQGTVLVSLKREDTGYFLPSPALLGPAVAAGIFVNRDADSGDVQIVLGAIEDEVWLELKKGEGEFQQSVSNAEGEERVKTARRVTPVGRDLFVVEYEPQGIF